MVEEVAGDVLDQALQACAAEPVHIPGIVQPFGCLLAIDPNTERVAYASENCGEFIGTPASELLGQEAWSVLGSEVAHNLNNAIAQQGFGRKLSSLGQFDIAGKAVEISTFESQGLRVLEVEELGDSGLGNTDALGTLRFLMEQVQNCRDEQTLFDLTVRLMRQLTGYDRVMVYRFDEEFNGEVVAEARPGAMEAYLGLRFPHWDIPPQARAIMTEIPLRFIQNVDQTPVKLWAENEFLAPLDITLAACRGVSAVHMQYLRNMGIKATMSLSIMVDGALWGMISFHHRNPRVLAPKLREVLISFLGVFTVKLDALQNQGRLRLISTVDRIKDRVLSQIEEDKSTDSLMPRVGPMIQDVFQAVGVSVLSDAQSTSFGRVPDPELLAHLRAEANVSPGSALTVHNLAERYPAFAGALNGCAGALVAAIDASRMFCVFREEVAQAVSWAGNPEKTLERVEGLTRLAPRGSFEMYLQEISGCCKHWSDQDIYFAERIWEILYSAERRVLINTLNRKQDLMIDELNHRVRNILALVRSVSRQARRRNGSLDSYAKSLESRIHALAAAHDIASGEALSAVDIKRLIRLELEPYEKPGSLEITGPDRFIRADIAPVFSLVVHELATNAAKYGALSVDTGRVRVALSERAGGLVIEWQESDGPKVAPPAERGFGSTLIEQAVPHELGGEAELKFLPDGVCAQLFLPARVLEEAGHRPLSAPEAGAPLGVTTPGPFSAADVDGIVLLLEDNFIIAKEMQDQLEDFGFDEVHTVSNLADATEFLDTQRPVLAVLDVNLGGQTSETIARRLSEEGVPFIFVTGYADKAELMPGLKQVPRLIKPVSDTELQDALTRLLSVAVPLPG